MNKTLQKAIRVEYTVLRAPLALLDRRVVSKLGDDSKVRSTFERGLDSLDSAAARLLERPAHAPGPAAARTAQPAEPQVLPADEQDEVEELAEELISEQEQQPLAGELAEDEELRRVQAELRAKHLVEEQHENGR